MLVGDLLVLYEVLHSAWSNHPGISVGLLAVSAAMEVNGIHGHTKVNSVDTLTGERHSKVRAPTPHGGEKTPAELKINLLVNPQLLTVD